jgi:hypothetical protein
MILIAVTRLRLRAVRILHWCDEAALVHWYQESPELPDWREAHRRMIAEGRPSKVNHPSADQLAFRNTPPRSAKSQFRDPS